MDMYTKLLKKRWSPHDINKTIRIINIAKASKHKHIKQLDSLVFLVALVIAIITNFVISIVLIPLLLALRGFVLYIIIITLGTSFGFFFEIIIRDIENLEKKHHLIITSIIPILTIINLFIMSIVANRIELFLHLDNTSYNAFIVALVYSASFMSPYTYHQIYKK
jgi:hypothetical protein